jgi:heme oxygenase
MAELRAASWPCHQRLERRINVGARFTDRSRYRVHLQKMWGFCTAFERALDPALVTTALRDYGDRRKVPALTRDLIELGCSPEEIALLPVCERLPACDDTAAALGCVYVFEGATLGGRSLLPLVASSMGFDALRGAAFLASYGENVTAMWREFGAAVENACTRTEERARAVSAAIETFECLGDWLCETAAH